MLIMQMNWTRLNHSIFSLDMPNTECNACIHKHPRAIASIEIHSMKANCSHVSVLNTLNDTVFRHGATQENNDIMTYIQCIH